MMASMKQWVTEATSAAGWAISSTGLVWGPLLALYAPRGLSSMYFNKHLRLYARRLVPFLDPFVSIDIVVSDQSSSTRGKEFGQSSNNAYKEVEAYLSKVGMQDAQAFCAEGTVEGSSGFKISLGEGQEVTDDFQGVTVWWWLTTTKVTINQCWQKTSCFRLMFPQQHRALILDEYLPHVRRQGRVIMNSNRGLRLYSNRRYSSKIDTSSLWSHTDFTHATTFDTLAMHPNDKREIVEDLDNFCRNKDYYRRIGKPWKRGYLLYGPPGTGKSTMIAAMANHLKYDIYDMELTSVSNNSDLRSLLVQIPGKSIVVFEDIDCCFHDVTSQRSNQQGPSTSSRYYDANKDDDKSEVTLSGLLNFIDGVWSGQTSERIIVFTTNFSDKLDQALIRSGWIDMQIKMSYCCFEAFQTLAKNYLGVEAQEAPTLFETVKKLLKVVEITPADVAECFLRRQADLAGSDRGVEMETACIERLIEELKMKAEEPKKRPLGPLDTIDIVSNKSSTRGEESGQSSNNAYKEVEAYLSKVGMQDAHAFCAEGTVQGSSGLLISLGEEQEVTDDFRGVVTVWWTKSTTNAAGRDTSCLRLMFPKQHRELILDEYLPHVRKTGRENLFVTIDIVDEKNSKRADFKLNEAFAEVKAYLSSECSRDALNLNAHGTVNDDSFFLSLRNGEEVTDSFSGVTLWWSSLKISTDQPNTSTTCYRLTFPQQHRKLILDEYLPHVRQRGRNIMIGKRGNKLYSNRGSVFDARWSPIDFEHPTTFDTLAMHPNNKRKIMEDLHNFSQNKDFYRRIGKPWKRGYLLYGPPGTGKSTMIAAMANYLKYDIYDMELTSVLNNGNLQSLLIKVPGKSIIVFEDIDCCLDDVTSQRSNQEGQSTLSRYPNDKESKVTLSGLLNFIDGIWAAQTGERIIVFTTNYPDKLDQALIRSGRMDMHIEMSYCGFEAFQTLAKNYLNVEAQEAPTLFQRVEELLKVVKMTPADVAECFLQSQNVDLAGSDRGVKCTGHLIDELEKKAAQPQPKKQRRCDTNWQASCEPVTNGGT